MFEGLKADLAAFALQHKWKLRAAALLVAFAGGGFASFKVFAEDATLTWAHPTQRVDNTALPLADILETQLDWGLCTAAGAFPAAPAGTVAVAAPGTQTVITNLSYGTWCFRGRTADRQARVSANSTIVSKINIAPPKPPVLSPTITLAYDLNGRIDSGLVRLGRAVGEIEDGAVCFGTPIKTNKGTYYQVKRTYVDLSRKPRSGRIVTKCAWS